MILFGASGVCHQPFGGLPAVFQTAKFLPHDITAAILCSRIPQLPQAGNFQTPNDQIPNKSQIQISFPTFGK